MKRNICVQFASSDIIVHMDDDDYYPPDSLITRVNALKNNDCVGCSTIASFHINKMISLIYQPNNVTTAAKRISCATLAYKKSFWEKQKFNNQDIINESYNFLLKRDCFELFWKDIIIVFYHKLNERNLFENKEANGWHFYKISDDLFNFFISLEKRV
jgi:glycosyltransferase involved in cell wall biosynthesis